MAAAMVDLMRAQRRQNVISYPVVPVILLIISLIQHGTQRGFYLILMAIWLVIIPISLHQQRQINRNYDRQIAPAVEDH